MTTKHVLEGRLEDSAAATKAPGRHKGLVWSWLAGPIGWALELTVGYMLVPLVRDSGTKAVFGFGTVASVLVVLSGALAGILGWKHRTSDDLSDETRRDLVRFLYVGGLVSCAFFAMSILAENVPKLILHTMD